MAKRIIWTKTAKKSRQEILKYWSKHNGTKGYSKNCQNYSEKKSRF